jgi:nitrogen fixation protein NifX
MRRGNLMKYRIAIATKDGKVVTDHFGHCKRYSIVEVENGEYHFMEYRDVKAPCDGGEHTTQAIDEVIKRIKDCRYAVVNQIGGGALQILTENQIKIYEYKGYVKDALRNLI